MSRTEHFLTGITETAQERIQKPKPLPRRGERDLPPLRPSIRPPPIRPQR